MKYVIKSCLSLRVSRFLKLSSTSNVKIFNHKGRNDSKFPHDFCNPRKLDSCFSQITFLFFKFRAVLHVVNKVVRHISESSFTSVRQISATFSSEHAGKPCYQRSLDYLLFQKKKTNMHSFLPEDVIHCKTLFPCRFANRYTCLLPSRPEPVVCSCSFLICNIFLWCNG